MNDKIEDNHSNSDNQAVNIFWELTPNQGQ